MSKILREENFEFDFTQSLLAMKFDKEREPRMSHCLKGADLLVEWEDEVWFVEVKNPKNSKKIENAVNKASRQGKESFLYLYLNNRIDSRPLSYFVLIGINEIPEQLLTTATEQLKRTICLANPKLIKNKFIEKALVFNESTWNSNFGNKCPVTRIT
jgi:hypothetical protein